MKKIIFWLFLKVFGVKKLVKQLTGGKVSGTLNIVLQVLAIVVQLGNAFAGIVPDEWKGIIVAVVAILQAILAKIGINRNPDGQPVTMAYDSATNRSIG